MPCENSHHSKFLIITQETGTNKFMYSTDYRKLRNNVYVSTPACFYKHFLNGNKMGFQLTFTISYCEHEGY